jgi:SAM-dependent methyltransferase
MSPSLDTSQPNVARVYDYWLGGKENFEADRAEAEKLLTLFPGLRQLVRENRAFIVRAVSWVAGQGIEQFADLGAGLPTSPSTHESAHAINPEARVIYVDNDPLVVTHADALLARGSDKVRAMNGDLHDPEALLASPGLRGAIDLDKPVCLILAAVLHLVNATRAAEVARAYTRALAPGSYVIISTARYDDPVLAEQIMSGYTAGTYFNHSRDEMTACFAGLDLIEPGLTDGKTWRAQMPASRTNGRAVYPLVGVARKPG